MPPKTRKQEDKPITDEMLEDQLIVEDEEIDEDEDDDDEEEEQTVASLVDYKFVNSHPKCVVREAHDDMIRDVSFCQQSADATWASMVATVGGKSANVYAIPDDTDSDVLSLLFHFTNFGIDPPLHENVEPSDAELQLYAVCWIVPKHNRDAFLLVGGEDKVIHVISTVHFDEFFQLKGHTGRILGLKSIDMQRDMLVSLANDKSFRVWNMTSLTCHALYELHLQPTALAVAWDGSRVYTGDDAGTLLTWHVPALPNESDSPTGDGSNIPVQPRARYGDEKIVASMQWKNAKIGYIALMRGGLVLLDKKGNGRIGLAYDGKVDAEKHIESLKQYMITTETEDVSNMKAWKTSAIGDPTKLLREIKLRGVVDGSNIDVANDGLHVLVGGDDGCIVIMNLLESVRELSTLDHDKLGEVSRVEWSPSGEEMIVTANHMVWRWSFIEPEDFQDRLREFKESQLRKDIEEKVKEEKKARRATKEAAAQT